MISKATCNMEAESEGKFTHRQIYECIKDGKYPKCWRNATNSLVSQFSRCRRSISITLVACFFMSMLGCHRN